mgnify:CR=1 FL=1
MVDVADARSLQYQDDTPEEKSPTKRLNVAVPLVAGTEYQVHGSGVESSSSAIFDPVKCKILIDYSDKSGSYVTASVSPKVVMERLGYSVTSTKAEVAKSASLALKASAAGVENKVLSQEEIWGSYSCVDKLARYLASEVSAFADRVTYTYALVKSGKEHAEYRLSFDKGSEGNTLNIGFYSIDSQTSTGFKKLYVSDLARDMLGESTDASDEEDWKSAISHLYDLSKTVYVDDGEFKLEFRVQKATVFAKLPSDDFTESVKTPTSTPLYAPVFTLKLPPRA